MRKYRSYIAAALTCLMASTLASCRQELCYDHYPVLDLNFEWEREWERDYGQHHESGWDSEYYGYEYGDLRPDEPEWINMISYYADGSQHESYVSPDGKSFIVDAGESRSVLLYNGDTECLVVSDVASLDNARAEATSRSRGRSSLTAIYEKHAGARTTNPPDMLYAAYIENLPGLQNHDRTTLSPKMQPLVYTYVIDYQFDEGIENVVIARGAIGGMAESVYLRTGVTSEKSSIVLFDCSLKSTGCHASVRSFGVPGFPDIYYGRNESSAAERNVTLNLEVMLKSGKVVEFDFDVSDQLKDQPRGGVIKVGGIKIEDQPSSSGGGNAGFVVEVYDWDEYDEIIDLPVGNQ